MLVVAGAVVGAVLASGCAQRRSTGKEPTLRERAEESLRGLFESYRNEDGLNFERYLAPTFYGTSDNGLSLTRATVRESIEDDFRNYDEIFFDWTIDAVREYEKGNVVEVEVTWNERFKDAVGANVGRETRRLSQHSTFVFRRIKDALLLETWRGAAAFGLAAPGGVGGGS
ncbi:MAG: hypothetical protein D6679_03855 [Candidatus Hydrogenedentota bacterium]|nr:MAG: hypothetical protein D6679_03855 [Candidatus Hydrogenedentota bacterium]